MSSDGVTRISVEISGSEISFETGRMAKQASGAVVVRQGDTMVLCTAVAGSVRDVDFLPLTVDVEERMYASGKIPGSFFKREGRPGEKGTLTARMIDRPIRPLFPKEWRYDTQLVAIPLSIDHEHPYDILAMNGASTALMISDIPLPTPVGAVRIGKIDGNFVVNPNEADLLADSENASDLDLIVAGTEEAILMVEAGANEIPEAEILDALDIAHAEIKKLCALQRELAEKVGKEKKVFETIGVDAAVLDAIRSSHGSALEAATQVEDKLDRQDATKAVEQQILEQHAPAAGESASEDQLVEAKQKRAAVQMAFDKLEKSIIRERIAVDKKRPDGRGADEIRDISIEVGVTPRTHGSALFTRGQTQALSVVAMGTLKEEMRLDTLGLETKKYYWHHYNFPPFSVGEAGRMGGVKRRDIGHGALAERALAPMVPSIEEFPYSIRVVSDILESNGSSSMASVCGSSLSLMDAGVPIKRPVAGIAMGLIKEGEDYIVLTDIAGVEDHLGDMDFKVAGTERGITALQMDIKITGVTFDILRDALSQAKNARTFILGKMADTIGSPREQLSQFAPRIQTIQIDPSQIGLLIGKGGETIRGLADEFESQIDVNDDGQVLIYSANGELGDALVERVRVMMKEVEVGDEYVGKVVKTTTFGAFIELSKGTDGLLHISNVSPGQRVESVEDVLNKGDEINVRVVEVDRERGRIGLRLADDPDIAGKSVEELAGVGTGGGAGAGADVRRATAVGATGRSVTAAPGDRAATAAERSAAAPAPDNHAGFRRASGHRARAQRALGGARLLDRHRIGRRVRRPGGHLAPARAHAVSRHRALRLAGDRPDLRRDGRRGQRGHRQGIDVAVHARARRPSAARLRGDGRHGLPSALRRAGDRARGRARGDRDVRRRPAGQGLRRARRGRVRRAPARARGDRHRGGRRRRLARAAGGLPRGALRAAEPRHRRRRLARARRARADGDDARSSARAGLQRPAGGRRAFAPGFERTGLRAPRALRGEGHRAVPRMRRRRRAGARGRAALCAARARRRARRDVLLAAVPGGARAPWPRLLGLLLLQPLRALRRDRPVRGHAPGQPRRRRSR